MNLFKLILQWIAAFGLLLSGLSPRMIAADTTEPNNDKPLEMSRMDNPERLAHPTTPNLYPLGLVWVVANGHSNPAQLLRQLEAALSTILGPDNYTIQARFTRGIVGFSIALTEMGNERFSDPSFKLALSALKPLLGEVKSERDSLIATMSTSSSIVHSEAKPDAHKQFEEQNPSQRGTTNTGHRVTLYVVDTGINAKHPEFKVGQVLAKGFSIDNSQGDCNGHGTGVAGTIAGQTKGVASDADVINVKVFSGCNIFTTASAVISGVDFIMNDMPTRSAGKVVVNMSLAGGYSQALNDAVFSLSQAGAIVVVAAGNGGPTSNSCDLSPASANGVITVAALDRNGNPASYSSRGGCVDVMAPGTHYAPHYDMKGQSGNMQIKSGTSIAAAVVAGQIARYLEASPTSARTINTLVANLFSPNSISTRLPTAPTAVNPVSHMIVSNSGSELNRDTCYVQLSPTVQNLATLTSKAINALASQESPTASAEIIKLKTELIKALKPLEKLGQENAIVIPVGEEIASIVNPVEDEIWIHDLDAKLNVMLKDLSNSKISASKRADHKATLLYFLRRLQDAPYTLNELDAELLNSELASLEATVNASRPQSEALAAQTRRLLESLPRVKERYFKYVDQVKAQANYGQDFWETYKQIREIAEKLQDGASRHESFEVLTQLNKAIQMLQRYQFKRPVCIREVGVRNTGPRSDDLVLMLHSVNPLVNPKVTVKDATGKIIVSSTSPIIRNISYPALPPIATLNRNSNINDYDQTYRNGNWLKTLSLRNDGWCTLTGPQQFCLAKTGKHTLANTPPTTDLMNVPVTNELVVPLPANFPTFTTLPEGIYTVEVTLGRTKSTTYFTKLIGVGTEGVGDRGCF